MLHQLLAAHCRCQRCQLAQGAVLVARGPAGSAVDAQLAQAEPAMQGGFAQRPGLDAATRDTAACAAEQAGRDGQAAVLLAEGEAVIAQQGQHHRQRTQRQPAQQQGCGQQQEGAGHAGMQVACVAEGFPAATLDGRVHHRPRHGLEQHAEGGDRQCPAAVGQQAHAHHVPARQAQQHLFGVGVGDRGGGHDVGGLRCLPTLAHQSFQRQRLVQLQHAHFGFRTHATGRFQAQLGHAEQAVQRVLPHFHVVDAGERDLAAVARQQSAAHGDRVAADAVAVAEVLQHRDQHQRGNRRQRNQLRPHRVAVTALAEHQQRHQRQEVVAQLHQQHEQPRPRVQAMVLATGRQRCGQGRRQAHRASASWSS